MARLISESGHGIDLVFGENLVGTAEGLQVTVREELGLDARHFCIRSTSEGCEIVDARSSTGTWVNGERVTGIVALKNGDVIRAGQLTLTLEDKKTEAGDSPPVEEPGMENSEVSN